MGTVSGNTATCPPQPLPEVKAQRTPLPPSSLSSLLGSVCWEIEGHQQTRQANHLAASLLLLCAPELRPRQGLTQSLQRPHGAEMGTSEVGEAATALLTVDGVLNRTFTHRIHLLYFCLEANVKS